MPRSQAPQDRLKAIEILLLWEGRVTNSRLREFFPVHAVQASRDFNTYRELAPGNCEPVMGERGYVATSFAKPVLTEGTFREYQMLVGAAGTVGTLQTGVPSESGLQGATITSRLIFSRVHTAIRTTQAVEIEYQSMRHPEGTTRRIYPHTIIEAGVRWHVRAYCETTNAFRDFNIGRIRNAVLDATPATFTAVDDVEWNTEATMRIWAHSELSQTQQQMIRNEYFGGTTGLVFTRRTPLLRYLIQSFRAAIDPKKEQPPDYILQVFQPEELPSSVFWADDRNGEI